MYMLRTFRYGSGMGTRCFPGSFALTCPPRKVSWDITADGMHAFKVCGEQRTIDYDDDDNDDNDDNDDDDNDDDDGGGGDDDDDNDDDNDDDDDDEDDDDGGDDDGGDDDDGTDFTD